MFADRRDGTFVRESADRINEIVDDNKFAGPLSVQNHLMDVRGQIRMNTLPITSDRGTVPQVRLSQEFECQSPIMK